LRRVGWARPFVLLSLAGLVDLGSPSLVDGVEWLYILAQHLLKLDESEQRLSDQEKELLQKLIVSPRISPVQILAHLDALNSFVSVQSVWATDQDKELYRENRRPPS
jgi:hypothetical protein